MKAEPASPGGAPFAGRSILIIEDHDDAREALRALLELEGHSVEAAASGPRGVELAQANMPDIALVDIGLPEVDGYEVARRLRGLKSGRPYLIALTGYGQPEDRRLAEEAGFDRHLVKPVPPKELRLILADPATRRTNPEPGP